MNISEKEARIENWLNANGEVQLAVAERLATKRPISVPHMLATEKCPVTAIDGFEGVLTRDGLFYPLIGSHSLMLNWMAAEELGTDVATYLKSVPAACYTAMTEYALKITHAITVRPGVQQYAENITAEQATALEQLADAELITINARQVRLSPRLKTSFTKLVHRQIETLISR
jgi:hypothetical protein